jgi:two-component system sensor histidine kinase SenX3
VTTSDAERLSLVVHEVRSPVAALAAIDAALATGDLDDVARVELIGLALAACRGIARVVGDAALASLDLEDVELGQLVREAVAAACLLGGTVRANIEPGHLAVTGDPARLRQALDNLVSNAVAHSPSGSEVTVSARHTGSAVAISVADRGDGIAAEDHERVFEPGVRLARGRSGQGLGLAVARSIAVAHGGSLTVESEPGQGSTFTLSLASG